VHRGHCKELEVADIRFRRLEESQRPSPELEDEAKQAQKAIQSSREAIYRADEVIRDRIRRELAGEA
jgi:hypothetical protein